MKYIIKDNQAGFVLKNGIFKKMITAGTYHFSKVTGYKVEIEEMSGEVDYIDVPYQILCKDSVFFDSTVHMEIPDGSVGFIYVNGKLTSFANRKEYIFWNVFENYEIKVVSMADTIIGSDVSKQMLSLVPGKYYTEVSVGDGETGLLYYDNILQEQLPKGLYRFWNYYHSINDLKGQLYSAVQLSIREITSNYKLDEILELKEQISKEIYKLIKEKEEMFCVNFLTAGIKDIILPGEIKNIMNSVLVAEKTAQANVISRREEVASTRSLLNTAKLMDENKTLYKLKELEYLERICERVGEISVNGNIGIMEQLSKMIG